MSQQTSTPKGTRDFSTTQMAERNYIFNTISTVYKTYGYRQIETPAMENLSALLGKYGDEGDKLLFRVLNSGDAFGKIDWEEALSDGDSVTGYLSSRVSEKGLRYDLTVPFARYVVQHRNDISFPFKRYQIQPVWRADRPQKGRYREFYQCDADVIGSDSLLNELELVQIVDDVFSKLELDVVVKINNRKVLAGLSEICGCPDKLAEITVAMDKMEKIGMDKVKEEMLSSGLPSNAVSIIEKVLSFGGETGAKIIELKRIFENPSHHSETGMLGIKELETLFSLLQKSGIKCRVEFDLSLARGLNYYTGAIFEVKSTEYEIGSICGGGRYDNLTGIFGLPGMSGVGISFGADRIYDVMKATDKFPSDIYAETDLLFANMDEAVLPYIVELASALRKRGLGCEIYPDKAKLKKQFEYAGKKSIKYISIIGSREEETRKINIKNLETGIQTEVDSSDLESVVAILSGSK